MKFLSNFILFICSLLITQSFGYLTNYTLNDAKDLKIETCKSDKDCKKNFQVSCFIKEGKKEGHCISTLYCRNDEKCVYKVEDNEKKTYVSYEPVSSLISLLQLNTPTLILESCNSKEASVGSCYTRKCEKKESCLSNNCDKEICITNHKKPLYICSNDASTFKGTNSDKFDRSKLTCKLAEQEICKKNNECTTNKCGKVNKDKICISSSNNNKRRFIIEILLIVLFALIAFVTLRCCLRRKAHGKVKKELKVKYENEEAFLNNKSYVELEDIDEFNIADVEKKCNKL